MPSTNLGRKCSLLLIAVAALVLFAPVPVAAQENAEDVLVRVNGTVDLPAGDALDVLVAVNSEAQVAGTVRDTLVVVNETATISGDIAGEVFAYNGEIILEPSARIGGDVTLVNSQLVQADGAVVSGRVVERAGAEMATELGRVADAVSFVVWIGMTILFVVVALVWAALDGRQLSGVAGSLAARPELAVVWTLIFWIAAPLVAVVAMVTVIGLPVGLAILIVLLPLLWTLGYVVTGTRLGFYIDDLRGARTDLEHPYLAAGAGVAILQLIGLLGAGAIVAMAWRRFRAPGQPVARPLLDPQI